MNKPSLLLLVASLTLASVSARAQAPAVEESPSTRYAGEFVLSPTVVHKPPIQGQLSFATVLMSLDNGPVMGKSAYASSESWHKQASSEADGTWMVTAFRLQGASHRWYFVFVGTSSDGAQSYQGNIYKVAAPLADIQKVFETTWRQIPATWKSVGTSVVRHQQ